MRLPFLPQNAVWRLRAMALVLAMPCCTALAATVTFVVPSSPGGSNDLTARAIAPYVSREINQSVIIDNRVGAGGNIGAVYAARAGGDKGVWLLTSGSILTMNPALIKNPGFDPARDLEAVSGVAKVPHVMLVNKDLPLQNIKDLVDAARAQPGKYFFGSAGNGSYSHLLMEKLKRTAGVEIAHVPFKGVAPALTELMAGRLQVLISTLPAALPYVRSGDVRAIAIFSEERNETLPNVPLAKEAQPGLVGDLWIGLFAPKGTPAAQVAQMRAAVAKSLADPALNESFRKMGAASFDLDPQQLDRLNRDEIKVWTRVIEESGVRAD